MKSTYYCNASQKKKNYSLGWISNTIQNPLHELNKHSITIVLIIREHPGFADLLNLRGGIIALITYHIRPTDDWNNYIIEICKFNYICNSEPVGDPEMIRHEDVAQVLKASRYVLEDLRNFNI